MSQQHHQEHQTPTAQGEWISATDIEHLTQHLAEVMTEKTAIVCVGNELCGDDGAGAIIAKMLEGAVPWSVYDTQTVPESFLMKIVSGRPETVLLIDSLAFGALPGAIEIFQTDQIAGQGPSTHGPAPLAFLEVLQMIHPCRCAVLGIQPKDTAFGAAMSDPVREAVSVVARAIRSLAGIFRAQKTGASPAQDHQ